MSSVRVRTLYTSGVNTSTLTHVREPREISPLISHKLGRFIRSKFMKGDNLSHLDEKAFYLTNLFEAIKIVITRSTVVALTTSSKDPCY